MSENTGQVPPANKEGSLPNNTLKQVSELSVRLSRIEVLLLNHYKAPSSGSNDPPTALDKDDNSSELETFNTLDPNSIQDEETELQGDPAPDKMSVASTEEFLPDILDEIQDLNCEALTIQQN